MVSELKIENLIEFSIVPNFGGKIIAEDRVQKMKVELRKMPFVELVVALGCDYPSKLGPILYIKDGFYTPFKTKMLESMI